jgi:hypothetical protein
VTFGDTNLPQVSGARGCEHGDATLEYRAEGAHVIARTVGAPARNAEVGAE